jgi:3-mercaptopyruvate sulfurtransferase SseA
MVHLKRVVMLAALALLVAAARPVRAAEDEDAKNEPFKKMTVDEVEQKLGQSDVHIYDGNSKSTYKKGHVPGAFNRNTKDITPSTMPAKKDATLIFYCQNTF